MTDRAEHGVANTAVQQIRRVARRLKHRAIAIASHVLRPVRRRAAVRRVRQLGAPRRVLCVCYGNICRSPYAAAAFAGEAFSSTASMVEVDSVGFIGPGRGSPAVAVEVARRVGIDLTGHVSKTLNSEIVGRSDLIIVMEASQGRRLRNEYGADVPGRVIVLGDLDPGEGDPRDIADPYGKDADRFSAVYQRIDSCIRALVSIIEWGAVDVREDARSKS